MIPDEELPSPYANAIATVVPSLYNGFGLQVIESLSQGTPIVCSDSTSLPGVTGDSALYFKPHDLKEIESRTEEVLQKDNWNKLKINGETLLPKYKKEAVVPELLNVYNNLFK